MPSHKELYQKIEELVIEDNLKDAFIKLKGEFEGLGRFELIDTTIILLNRLSSFNLRVLQDIEAPAVAEKNKLVLGALNLLTELKGLHKSLNVLKESRVVAREEVDGSKTEAVKKVRILFSGANPEGTAKLDIEKEALVIQYEIDNSDAPQKFRSKFIFNTVPDVLIDHILKFKPSIFHFAGHSVEDYKAFMSNDATLPNDQPKQDTKEMGLVFEDVNGGMKVIEGGAFASIISVQRESIDCVVLNTQYSNNVARKLSGMVKYAIGVEGLILDLSAYHFTRGFYKAIANNRDIPNAFKVGKSMVRFNTSGEESEKYVLFSANETV